MAVYGTLKEGHHNYNVHISPKKAIWKGTIDLPYRMVSNGKYPLLLRSHSLNPITIEIYELDEVQAESIRQLEEPYGLRLDTIKVETYDAGIWVLDKADAPDGFVPVEDGNFKPSEEWDDVRHNE